LVRNLDVFDFALETEHMKVIDALHDGTRVLHDPLTFTGT
jgi:2,5-diketo-D-gluconate reductase A